MTPEERFERIEHLTAGIAEERRKDRDEYKNLWRDLATKHENLTRSVDALAVETRLRFEQVADRIEELATADARLAARMDATNDQLTQRIASLVSAIGEFIARSQQPPIA